MQGQGSTHRQAAGVGRRRTREGQHGHALQQLRADLQRGMHMHISACVPREPPHPRETSRRRGVVAGQPCGGRARAVGARGGRRRRARRRWAGGPRRCAESSSAAPARAAPAARKQVSNKRETRPNDPFAPILSRCCWHQPRRLMTPSARVGKPPVAAASRLSRASRHGQGAGRSTGLLKVGQLLGGEVRVAAVSLVAVVVRREHVVRQVIHALRLPHGQQGTEAKGLATSTKHARPCECEYYDSTAYPACSRDQGSESAPTKARWRNPRCWAAPLMLPRFFK